MTDEPNTDTNTDDEIGDLDVEAAPLAQAIPVAEAAPPPPGPAAPRVFPQHYTLLFGCSAIMMGCLTVWERAPLAPMDVYGFQMISGAFTLLLAFYGFVVGVLNILQGRLRGMGAASLAALLAIIFGIKTITRISDLPDYVSPGDMTEKSGWQDGINQWAGQFGPGVWLALLGGLVILMIFLKAFVPSKKAEPEPARRRRR